MIRQTLLLVMAVGAFTNAATASFRMHREACSQSPQLTPEVARQALLELLRTKPNKPLDVFTPDIVERMGKIGLDAEKKDGEYRWTGAAYIDPTNERYVVIVPMSGKMAPLIQPNYKGLYIHMLVYEGRFVMYEGRWMAALPRFQYALLD